MLDLGKPKTTVLKSVKCYKRMFKIFPSFSKTVSSLYPCVPATTTSFPLPESGLFFQGYEFVECLYSFSNCQISPFSILSSYSLLLSHAIFLLSFFPPSHLHLSPPPSLPHQKYLFQIPNSFLTNHLIINNSVLLCANPRL